MSLVKSKKKKKAPTLSSLKKKAWDLLSKIIRQGAADHAGYASCYTCGDTKHWKEQQAGHGIDGRHGAVLFDEEILRVQCYVCNVCKHGNHKVYALNLIKENGMEWYEQKLADSHREVKRTRTDYLDMIEIYQQRLKELEGE